MQSTRVKFLTPAAFMSLLMVFLVPRTVVAQVTWTVDASGGGDFTEIQPAINAAQDGDLILVRDTGDYLGFNLNKAVIIKASAAPFDLVDQGLVDVRGLGAGETAGISGMNARGRVAAWSCSGTVLLEDLTIHLSTPSPAGISESLGLYNCSNVFVDRLDVQPAVPGLIRTASAVFLYLSQVRINDATIAGETGPAGVAPGDDGGTGGAGLRAHLSIVTLSNPSVIGGTGGMGNGAACCLATSGSGGDGIDVFGSFLTILGTENHVIEGGAGGPGDAPGWVTPGDGAPAISVTSHRTDISRVVTLGGLDGDGIQRFPTDVIGNVTRMDTMAALNVTPSLKISNPYTLSLDGIEPGNAMLVYANVAGAFRLGGFDGPDLAALPGGIFGVIPLGRTDALGDVSKTIQLSSDPLQIGQHWVFQAGLFGDSGVKYLTNAVVRFVGS